MVAVGGSGVGRALLEKVIAAYPLAKRLVPELRMVVVDRAPHRSRQPSEPAGLEVHGYVNRLYRHLSVCDLAVVQGGLTTTMELAAAKRPFLYFPLRHHFEQNFHVRHRLDRYGAGRCMDYATSDPDLIAAAVARPHRSGGRLPRRRDRWRGPSGPAHRRARLTARHDGPIRTSANSNGSSVDRSNDLQQPANTHPQTGRDPAMLTHEYSYETCLEARCATPGRSTTASRAATSTSPSVPARPDRRCQRHRLPERRREAMLNQSVATATATSSCSSRSTSCRWSSTTPAATCTAMRRGRGPPALRRGGGQAPGDAPPGLRPVRGGVRHQLSLVPGREEVAGAVLEHVTAHPAAADQHGRVVHQLHYVEHVRDRAELDELFRTSCASIGSTSPTRPDGQPPHRRGRQRAQCRRGVRPSTNCWSWRRRRRAPGSTGRADIDALQAATGRTYTDAERDEIRTHKRRSYRWTFLVSGLNIRTSSAPWSNSPRRSRQGHPGSRGPVRLIHAGDPRRARQRRSRWHVRCG